MWQVDHRLKLAAGKHSLQLDAHRFCMHVLLVAREAHACLSMPCIMLTWIFCLLTAPAFVRAWSLGCPSGVTDDQWFADVWQTLVSGVASTPLKGLLRVTASMESL